MPEDMRLVHNLGAQGMKQAAIPAAFEQVNGHGPMFPISDVTYIKPMLLPHGGWPMAAGPASRLDSFELGDKTGLRL